MGSVDMPNLMGAIARLVVKVANAFPFIEKPIDHVFVYPIDAASLAEVGVQSWNDAAIAIQDVTTGFINFFLVAIEPGD
jgi:hypothetical protein